jgi:hypothetical protein
MWKIKNQQVPSFVNQKLRKYFLLVGNYKCKNKISVIVLIGIVLLFMIVSHKELLQSLNCKN